MEKKIFLFFLIIVTSLHAQESSYDHVKKLYENFEYDKVIQLTNDILTQPNVEDSTKVDIYLMRAVSFFARGNFDKTKSSFQSILHLKKDYSPNTQLLNPTLVSMFNNTKVDYLKKLTEEEAKKDSATTVSGLVYQKQISFGGAFIKNIFLPGWGQLSLGKDKGLLYGIAYIINIGVLSYYISDSNKKLAAYQKEVSDQKFDQLYSDYQKSHKIQTGLWISLGVIWLYSQIDLLIFHNEEKIPSAELNKISFLLTPGTTGNYHFSMRIRF